MVAVGQQLLQKQVVNFGLAVEPGGPSNAETHTFGQRYSSAGVASAVVLLPNWLVAPVVKLVLGPEFVDPAFEIGVTAEAGAVAFSVVA